MIIDPAIGLNYFQRDDVYALLLKRTEAFSKGYRQNIGLLGRPYIGKTSIVQNFLRNITFPDIIPIYIEVLPEPLEYFVNKYMGTILHSYLSYQGVRIPPTFDSLVKKAKPLLPETMKKMRLLKSHLVKRDARMIFDLLFSLTATLQDESGKKVILVLDEFHRLERWGHNDSFKALSQQIMIQKDTMYIVTSSHPNVAKHVFMEELSLLFGNFETIEIEPLSFNESFDFIRSRLEGVLIDDAIINFLIHVTDGYPFYLDVIVREMKNTAQKKGGIVNDACLAEALEQVLFHSSGTLYQHFLLRFGSFHKGGQYVFYLNVLLAIASGHKKLTAIARFVEKDSEETKKGLQRLVDEQIVSRSGYFYYIRDALLKFWLKYVFQKKVFNLGVWNDSCTEEFKTNVFDVLDSLSHERNKELSKRVEELLRSFKNDVVEVNSKRFKCPSFSEVYLRPTNGRIYPLYAKAPTSRWLCQVAGTRVEEEDIQVLVSDSKKLRKKVHKRILIIPYGISLDAKILAKEANIALWNLRSLNFVFDLFDKPKVIIEDTEEMNNGSTMGAVEECVRSS